MVGSSCISSTDGACAEFQDGHNRRPHFERLNLACGSGYFCPQNSLYSLYLLNTYGWSRPLVTSVVTEEPLT